MENRDGVGRKTTQYFTSEVGVKERKDLERVGLYRRRERKGVKRKMGGKEKAREEREKKNK